MSEPSNKELMHFLTDIKTDVGEIKVQVKATNGRVGKLENWQAFMQGGLAVLTIMVVPIVIYLLTHWK